MVRYQWELSPVLEVVVGILIFGFVIAGIVSILRVIVFIVDVTLQRDRAKHPSIVLFVYTVACARAFNELWRWYVAFLLFWWLGLLTALGVTALVGVRVE